MENKSIASSQKSQKSAVVMDDRIGFDKLYHQIKDSIFQVLYLVLKQEDAALWYIAVTNGVDYLQMMYFCFYEKVNSIWNSDEILGPFYNVINFINVSNYIENALSWPAYLTGFYVCLVLIVLVIVNIFYVSYSFSRKKVSVIWPVKLLRGVAGLVVTVGFLPITEFLVGMIQCVWDDSGEYVHWNFTDIECWEGAHIIHGTLSIVLTTVFILISGIVSSIYFEIRMVTSDPTARQNSIGDMAFIANKIALQVTFAFLTSADQWWLVTILMVGSSSLMYTYVVKVPFYNKTYAIIMKIFNTVYFWTALMLFLSKTIGEDFSGGLVVYLVGLPFIPLWFFTNQSSSTASVVSYRTSFKSPEQLNDHLRSLLQLIDSFQTDKNARMLLTGYIEKHKDACPEDDCPLRYRATAKRKKHHEEKLSNLEESVKRLIFVIDRFYVAGTKKFKKSTSLRISFAFFLFERLKNNKRALAEITKAKTLDPGFGDQFVIYRLERMINDGVDGESDGDDGGGLDLVGKIASENFQSLAEGYMTESANLHKEFWMELREEKPDLRKLNYLGSKVNTAMNNAKDYWNRLQKFTVDAQFLKIYGRFLIDIQNERSGEELIRKAKMIERRDLEMKKFKEIEHEEAGELGNASSEPLPYVIVSGTPDSFGKIKKANALFSILVGTQNDDIIDKKINTYMPELYGMFHDSFMRQYLQREDDTYGGFLNSENSLFIKNKNGYIIPSFVKVKPIELPDGYQFMATFRTTDVRKLYAYFICRPDGIITDVSASAITILNLNLAIRKNNVNIDTIVPGALTDKKYQFGKEFSYELKEFDGDLLPTVLQLHAIVTPIELRDKTNKEFAMMIREYYDPQAFSQQKDGAGTTPDSDKFIYGYIVKVEKVDRTITMKNPDLSRIKSRHITRGPGAISEKSERSSDGESPPSLRLVKKDSSPTVYKGGVGNEEDDWIYGFRTDKEDLEIGAIFQSANLKKELTKAVEEEQQVDRVREEINYGEGIQLRRLVGGRFIDIRSNVYLDTEERERLEKEWDEEESLFMKRDEEDGFGERTVRKTRTLKKMIQEALEDNQELPSVFRLRLISVCWVLIALGFSAALFSQIYLAFDRWSSYTEITTLATNRIVAYQDLVDCLLGLSYMSEDSSIITDAETAIILPLRESLIDDVDQIISITHSLKTGSVGSIYDQYSRTEIILQHYNNGSVDISHEQTQSLLQVASLAYNFSSESLENININNRVLRDVVFNVLNRIVPQLSLDFAQFTSNALQEYASGIPNTLIVLTVIELVCGVVFSGWIVYYLIKIESQKENVLFLFLEIPMKNIEGISKRRDRFMDFFQAIKNTDQKDSDASDSFDEISEIKGKGDGKNFSPIQGDDSQIKQSEDEEQEDQLKRRKKMIKKYKTQKFKKARVLFLKICAVVMLCCIYILCALLMLHMQKQKLSKFMTQLSEDALIPLKIQTAIDALELYGLDPNFPITNSTVNDYTNLTIMNITRHKLGEFYVYVLDQDEEFKTNYKQVFFGDACAYLGGDYTSCSSIGNSSLLYGVLNYEAGMFKYLKDLYLSLKHNVIPQADFRSLLMTSSVDFYFSTRVILQKFFDYEKEFLKSDLNTSITMSTVILAVYIVIVILFLSLYWLPIILRLNNEVWRTTRMINMIPIDVVQRIRSIRVFLRKLIRSRARK